MGRLLLFLISTFPAAAGALNGARLPPLALIAMLFACPALAVEQDPGRIAVLVHTTTGAAAMLDVAERVYGAVTVVDTNSVRTAMSADRDNVLTDARGEEVRVSYGADRLIVIELHTTGTGVRILHLRAFDKTGAVQRRSVDVTDETILDRLTRTLEGLPSWRPREPRVSDWLRFASTEDAVFFDVNLFAGRKMLSESEWGALATQNEVGAFATIGGTRWPVHLALEGYGSRGFDQDTTATITEFGAGARRVFELGKRGRLRPHLGAGIEFVRADYVVVDEFDAHDAQKDRGTGGWVDGGLAFRAGKFGNVGVLIRYSSAEVRLGSRTVSAGGVHVGVAVGLGSARTR